MRRIWILAAVFFGLIGAAAAQPVKTYTIELDAEKDYFAPGAVQIVAVSRAGEAVVGELDVTVRRRKEIAVPAGTRELVFRLEKIAARLRLPANGGTIVVRPLSRAGSASGIAWMLGRRGGIAVEALRVGVKGN
jgi:hypothetical protein